VPTSDSRGRGTVLVTEPAARYRLGAQELAQRRKGERQRQTLWKAASEPGGCALVLSVQLGEQSLSPAIVLSLVG